MTPELIASFDLLISYYRIDVFDPALVNPFNDYRREHSRQGFAWRPFSVSFGVPDIQLANVEVLLCEAIAVRPDAARAIVVPFVVRPESKTVVAVVGDERDIAIPPGKFALLFDFGRNKDTPPLWCQFTFVSCEAAAPQVLVRDAELTASYPLAMTADPAAP